MYLLDTNVVSELRKVRAGKADANVAAWAEGVDAGCLYISVITVHEIALGVLLKARADAAQGALLSTWLHQHVLPAFAGRILGIDAAVALRCAQLHVPDPRPSRDAFIAATALIHGLAVVTRDVADFERIGARIVNPWDKPH